MSWLTEGEEGDRFEDKYEEKYADYEARDRPNPKGSRARTKIRPEHGDAIEGRVLTVDRGRYSVLVGENADEHEVTASRASELRTSAIVTGDRVDLVGDTSGAEGTLARIVRIRPRSTVLRRSADDTDEVERIIVANADQMLIVVAAADPEPRPRLVDRYLVASFDAGIDPILCITKTDLADPDEFLANFAGLELTIVTSEQGDVPIARLNELLAGHTTVAVGHSGVGKSTLVNALVPDANRAIGRVNSVTGRGRHTSSSSFSYRVASHVSPDQGADTSPAPSAATDAGPGVSTSTDAGMSSGTGWIIDTPGVRSFGLGHVKVENILASFTDLAELAKNCPRGCTHLSGAPDCAITQGVREGALGNSGALRLDSLQRLLASLAP